MRAPAHHRYTWDQFCAMERGSNIKHEFLDGEIFAMAGGTPEHAALAAEVIGQLGAQLDDGPCRSFTSDLRIRVVATGLSTYPDVSVVCGELERDPQARDVVLNPTVVVEVTSDSTEEWDRGGKFDHYRQIPSLQEYVLISHRERLVEVFRRGEGDRWGRVEARPGASARFESIRAELAVDRLYRGISLRES